MKEQFIPYELALNLKELGFNEECLGGYYYREKLVNYKFTTYKYSSGVVNKNNTCFIVAPLWQQAFDWFRDKYNVHYIIYQVELEDKSVVWDWDIVDNNSEEEYYDIPYFNSYEEARMECLKKLIEIYESKETR